MAKLRFMRSSRTNTQQGDCLQQLEHRSNDKTKENSCRSANKIETVSNSQLQSDKADAKVNHKDKKVAKKRKHSAFRFFYPYSSSSSSSSTDQNAAITSVSSNSKDFPPRPLSSAPLGTTPKTKDQIPEKVQETKSTKHQSRSTRLFSSRLSNSSPDTIENGGGKQTNNNAMTSNKHIISIPLPPYAIEATEIDGVPFVECPLCVLLVNYNETPDLRTCSHRTCMECMQRYLKTEINHSRLKITCPICSEPLSQQVIREILKDDKFYFKYESFMLRKVLAAEPDARWCPAPDCGYAVLATGCASCPRLVCEREGCNTEFCYHCKQEWHPNQTCSAASIQRNKRNGFILNAFNITDLISSADDNESGATTTVGATSKDDTKTKKDKNGRKFSRASQQAAAAAASSLRPEDIKECPVCSSRIIKMNDGSCNHMTCSICETDFCWLCMKEISDLHYFSPSGCTFWGKKPWSRKKKLFWRLGMLVGAPICIIFIAGIAVPAIVIGIPVWAARKLHTRLEKKEFGRYRKNAIITGGVLLSFIVSPIISAMALAVGIPILLGYVYGVVPLSLCRSSGGCLSSSPSVDNLNQAQHQISSNTSVVNQARDQLQRLQIQAAQQEYRRQQMKTEQVRKSRDDIKHSASSSNQATPLPFSDVVSVDTTTNCRLGVNSNHLGGESIGEPSMYMSNISLDTNSIGNVTNIAERCSRDSTSVVGGSGVGVSGYEDRESASNVALSGSILSHKTEDAHSTKALAGSIVSKESGGYTLVPAEVHTPSISHQSKLHLSLDENVSVKLLSTSASPGESQDISEKDECNETIASGVNQSKLGDLKE